jgi:hypothetical protein
MSGFSKMWEYILTTPDWMTGRALSHWPTDSGGEAVVLEDLPELMRTHALYDDKFRIRIKNVRHDLFGKHDDRLPIPVLSAFLACFIRHAADLAKAYPRNKTMKRCASLVSPIHSRTRTNIAQIHTRRVLAVCEVNEISEEEFFTIGERLQKIHIERNASALSLNDLADPGVADMLKTALDTIVSFKGQMFKMQATLDQLQRTSPTKRMYTPRSERKEPLGLSSTHLNAMPVCVCVYA